MFVCMCVLMNSDGQRLSACMAWLSDICMNAGLGAHTGPGMKFSIGNEIFNTGMKFSIENENFKMGGPILKFSSARE